MIFLKLITGAVISFVEIALKVIIKIFGFIFRGICKLMSYVIAYTFLFFRKIVILIGGGEKNTGLNQEESPVETNTVENIEIPDERR